MKPALRLALLLLLVGVTVTYAVAAAFARALEDGTYLGTGVWKP